jgi:hypothetical protein
MASYFVEFTAYINERMRPEGFPREVKIKDIYTNVDNFDTLVNGVRERFQKLAAGPGLTVLKNPDEIIESGINQFSKYWYLPWHQITHLGVEVKQITEVPENSPEFITKIEVPDKKPKEIVN